MNLNNLTKGQKIIGGAAIFIVLYFILAWFCLVPGFRSCSENPADSFGPGKQTALSFWGFDDSQAVQPLIAAYSARGYRVDYKQINKKIYEKTLINSLATNNGPDVFMFHRSWLMKHGDKIAPVSETQFPFINLGQLYPDVIAKDFSYQNKIYALPLYLDTLALFYNKDVFNAKGVAINPTTWNDFKNLITLLTELDLNRQIKKSGATIGGSGKSIENAPDIFSLLLLQFGSSVDAGNRFGFDNKSADAFNFYFQFGNPGSSAYTWSDNFGDAIDAFSSGDAAMFFGYAREIPVIKQKNPYLNFSAILVPQFNLDHPVNYADYWGLAVSKQSRYQQQAWDFIISSTANPQTSLAYLKSENEAPALKSLINQYYNNLALNVFAKQALTAKSIYLNDADAFRNSISNMIESVLTGKANPQRAMQQAEAEINQN